MKRGWTWLVAVWAALLAASAQAEGPCVLPPGKDGGEKRTVALPGGAELTLAWIGAGTADIGDGKAPVRMPVDGFWIGVCEVTQKQWESVMGGNPSYFRGEELAVASLRGELPVECVSWKDCMEFCRQTGLRLPTEMEWLRARDSSRWVSTWSWTADNSEGRTHPAGRSGPGGGGVFDLDGNVGEWCADWFAPLPTAPATNYAGSATGTERVVCGGNWCGDQWFDMRLRKDRLSLPPDCRYNNVGFRVCLSPSPDGEGAGEGEGAEQGD